VGKGLSPYEQYRTFRIGFWSSYLDPDFQKEIQRRQRHVRRKYVEALNRRLSWDRQSYSHFKKPGRNITHHEPDNSDVRPLKKGSIQDEQSTIDHADLGKQGGALHIEHNPVDRLLKSHHDMIEKMLSAQSKFFSRVLPKNEIPSSASSNSSTISFNTLKKTVSDKLSRSSSTETPYTIDPITNKRVYPKDKIADSALNASATSIPLTSLESWLPPLQILNPFSSDPMRAWLSEYETKGKEEYKPVYYREPDGKLVDKPCSVLNGLEAYDDKVSYGPVYHNEPDGKPIINTCAEDAGLQEYDQAHAYGPVMYREPDGKLLDSVCQVKTGLEDFDEKAKYGHSKAGESGTSRRLRYELSEDKREDLDLLRASDLLAASGLQRSPKKETEAEKSSKREQLEQDFHQIQKSMIEDLRIEHSELLNRIAHARGRVNAKIAQVESSPISTSGTHTLTGNYVRDFPEDFAASWTSESSNSGVLAPTQIATEAFNLKSIANSTASDVVSTPIPQSGRIQPALDRDNSVNISLDSQSGHDGQAQKRVDKQKHKELVRELRQIYEEAYGVLDTNHRAAPMKAASTTAHGNVMIDQPISYKVLAYDPTMQSITEAETTSIVTDSATPLTPAEVLLRLSNPAKFFPHFAPLQASGYEIMTGGGDVLVFRKVREAMSRPALQEALSSTNKAYASTRQNPIDGMRPIAPTGNFASPTGFVNYDLPQDKVEAVDTESQFKSNIDVRREEPVFSGKRNWQENPAKKKSSKAKKILIGAAWVGACSYAVGVVAEFFKTGGAEGFPKGF